MDAIQRAEQRRSKQARGTARFLTEESNECLECVASTLGNHDVLRRHRNQGAFCGSGSKQVVCPQHSVAAIGSLLSTTGVLTPCIVADWVSF